MEPERLQLQARLIIYVQCYVEQASDNLTNYHLKVIRLKTISITSHRVNLGTLSL